MICGLMPLCQTITKVITKGFKWNLCNSFNIDLDL